MSYEWFVALAATKLIPLVLVTIAVAKKWHAPAIWFGLLILLGTINDSLSMLIRGNNLWLNYLYNPVEAILLAGFFATCLRGSIVRFGLPLSGILLGVVIVSEGVYSDWQTFNNFSKAAIRVMVISYCLAYFYQLAIGRVLAEGWLQVVVGAMLFYYASSFIYFTASRYLMPGANTGNMTILFFMAVVHSFVNAVCNILYAFGIWKHIRSSSSPVQYSVR